MKIVELLEAIDNNWHPKIGWWLDNDPITLYHGSHESNLDNIKANGLVARKDGRTAGKVSMALDPNTSLGYANMKGGEIAYEKNPINVPTDQRIVVKFSIPKSYLQSHIWPIDRYNHGVQLKRLTDKTRYDKWVSEKTAKKGTYYPAFDQEYYAYAEVGFRDIVPAKFITGILKK